MDVFSSLQKIIAAGTAAAVSLTTPSASPVSTTDTSAQKPNVVVILMDDTGFNTISAYQKIIGQNDYLSLTPNIDSIAQNGIMFRQGYTTAPLCAPSRAGLMLGQYQQRCGFENNSSPSVGLPLDLEIFPQFMKEQGYATGMFGKWHLGDGDKFAPSARGFDQFYGFTNGAQSTYYDEHSFPDAIYENINPRLPHPPSPGFYIGEGAGENKKTLVRGIPGVGLQKETEPEYLTDAFAREAVRFIDENTRKDQPFFLYLPFNAIHYPLFTTKDEFTNFGDINDPAPRILAAITSRMDIAVGRVLDELKATGQFDNTLLFILGDNGNVDHANDAPLRGSKSTMFEGGIRNAFMVQWPNKYPKGVIYDNPVISSDILPTAIMASGGTLSGRNFDGVDLTPYITGQNNDRPHDTLYWRMNNILAVRDGDYKYMVGKDSGPANQELLFNLASDPYETTNIKDQEPDKFAELKAKYKAWNSTMLPPLIVNGKSGEESEEDSMPKSVEKPAGKKAQAKKFAQPDKVDEDISKGLIVSNSDQTNDLIVNNEETKALMSELETSMAADFETFTGIMENWQSKSAEDPSYKPDRLDDVTAIAANMKAFAASHQSTEQTIAFLTLIQRVADLLDASVTSMKAGDEKGFSDNLKQSLKLLANLANMYSFRGVDYSN